MAEFKEYSDMTEEERHNEIEKVTALFVGLPGVVGAPMISGPNFWGDVAEHLVECGMRIVAEPIKHYEAPTSLERTAAAGKWAYDAGQEPDETYDDKIKRLAREQREGHAAKVAQMRADGVLPPAGLSAEQRAQWKRKRATKMEASAFNSEVRARKAGGTLVGSPLADIGKPRRKK